jgi:hypothetical protein
VVGGERGIDPTPYTFLEYWKIMFKFGNDE